MADATTPATVSLSRSLGSETPRHPAYRRDNAETMGETSGLKALARLVLARDRRRDIERRGVSRVPSKIETLRKTALAGVTSAKSLYSAEAEHTTIVGHEDAIPRIGIPEIPDEPVPLRDGRRLWRFSQAQDCPPDRASALIDQAHWCGAVLVADGCELIVVERWFGSLPVETLCELNRCASGVIAALHQQPLVRCQAGARRRGERWPSR
jgi:hypothetical protein